MNPSTKSKIYPTGGFSTVKILVDEFKRLELCFSQLKRSLVRLGDEKVSHPGNRNQKVEEKVTIMAMSFSIPHLQRAVRCFPVLQTKHLAGATALTGAGVSLLYRSFPSLYQNFKKSPNLLSWAWQLRQAGAWHHKKIVVGGGAFLLSTAFISTLYPYLNLIANTPFPKSFILRFRPSTGSSIVALLGVGILLGKKFLISIFKIKLPHKTDPKLANVTPSEPMPNWALLPQDILANLIFPHVLNAVESSPEPPFANITLVCKTWRERFSENMRSTDGRHMFPTLERIFVHNHFTVHNVFMFFDRYLSPQSEGEGLHFDFKALCSDTQDYITPDHLEAFAKRFPRASMSSLMLCIPADRDMTETAKWLSIFLEQDHIDRLTIIPEPTKSLRVRSLFNKKEKAEPLPQAYPSQLIKLLTSLKGRVSVLRLRTFSENYMVQDNLFPILSTLSMPQSSSRTVDMAAEKIQILQSARVDATLDSTKILDVNLPVHHISNKQNCVELIGEIIKFATIRWIDDKKISQQEYADVMHNAHDFYNS